MARIGLCGLSMDSQFTSRTTSVERRKRLLGADRDLARVRVDAENVERDRESRRPRPLRWPTVNRWMPAWRPTSRPRAIDDGPRERSARRRVPLDEARVVVVGDEADLLALRLVGGRQVRARAAMRRTSALSRCPDREDARRRADPGSGRRGSTTGPCRGRRREAGENGRSPDPGPCGRSGRWPRGRCPGRGCARAGVELHVGVAVRAGKGSAALGVVAHEGLDDALAERLLEVQDVVGRPSCAATRFASCRSLSAQHRPKDEPCPPVSEASDGGAAPAA